MRLSAAMGTILVGTALGVGTLTGSAQAATSGHAGTALNGVRLGVQHSPDGVRLGVHASTEGRRLGVQHSPNGMRLGVQASVDGRRL